ncbi:MAG: DUF1294 domain-containing protein [Lachnospiraceae bacterium]|nr:DUF1294 domain-containing protein [Lachnospiraceae bacterium]
MTLLQTILLTYLLIANLISLILYGIDKRKAIRDKWRIPEKTLLLSALFGGAPGALWGMILFHHKTKKAKFFITIPVLFVLQVVLFAWLFWRLGIALY